jgi:hypothetical protein
VSLVLTLKKLGKLWVSTPKGPVCRWLAGRDSRPILHHGDRRLFLNNAVGAAAAYLRWSRGRGIRPHRAPPKRVEIFHDRARRRKFTKCWNTACTTSRAAMPNSPKASDAGPRISPRLLQTCDQMHPYRPSGALGFPCPRSATLCNPIKRPPVDSAGPS